MHACNQDGRSHAAKWHDVAIRFLRPQIHRAEQQQILMLPGLTGWVTLSLGTADSTYYKTAEHQLAAVQMPIWGPGMITAPGAVPAGITPPNPKRSRMAV